MKLNFFYDCSTTKPVTETLAVRVWLWRQTFFTHISIISCEHMTQLLMLLLIIEQYTLQWIYELTRKFDIILTINEHCYLSFVPLLLGHHKLSFGNCPSEKNVQSNISGKQLPHYYSVNQSKLVSQLYLLFKIIYVKSVLYFM